MLPLAEEEKEKTRFFSLTTRHCKIETQFIDCQREKLISKTVRIKEETYIYMSYLCTDRITPCVLHRNNSDQNRTI